LIGKKIFLQLKYTYTWGGGQENVYKTKKLNAKTCMKILLH
jgi:hypothetical protein